MATFDLEVFVLDNFNPSPTSSEKDGRTDKELGATQG